MLTKGLGSRSLFISVMILLSSLVTGCDVFDKKGNAGEIGTGNSEELIEEEVTNKNIHPILARQGVEIYYPSEWKTQAYYNPTPLPDEDPTVKPREHSTFFKTREIIDFLPTNSKNVTVELEIEVLPSQMTLEEAYDEVIDKKLKLYTNEDRLGKYSNFYENLKLINLKRSKQKAYQFTYSRLNNQERVRGKVIFAVKNNSNELYILHYQAPEEKYERYFDEVDEVLQSFKLNDKDTSIVLSREDVQSIFKREKFFCGEVYENNESKSIPTIFANHHWGNVPIMKFIDPEFEDWPPQKRCEEIAGRLTNFYHRGLFVHVEVGYLPKNLLRIADTLREDSDQPLNVLKGLEDVIADFDPKEIGLRQKDKNNKIPVICISAKEGDHLDLPRKHVALLMTMKDKDDHDKILKSIKSLTSNPLVVQKNNRT